MEVILFTKNAGLSAAVKKKIEAAGYLPVEVEDMDAVKILPAPMPQATVGAITKAAMEALEESDGLHANSTFMKSLAAAIKPSE